MLENEVFLEACGTPEMPAGRKELTAMFGVAIMFSLKDLRKYSEAINNVIMHFVNIRNIHKLQC